jgi:hypothetical protein
MKSTRVLYILFLAFLVVSCKKEKEENLLVGNWYGFDSDSIYYELYISEDLIVLNHENLGLAEYSYEKVGDKLITVTPLFFERVWTFQDLNDSVFVITDTLEKHHYKRLHISHDFFKSIQDSIELQQFKDAFIARHKTYQKSEEE